MTLQNDPADGTLAMAARLGDQQAFAVLMRRHKGWLYRFIRNYSGNSEEAQDLVQEAFVSAWRALSRFDPDRPFTIWLRQIALNKCRDHARRAGVRRAALSLFAIMTEDGNSVPAADAATDSSDALNRLEVAVAQLPRGLKEPLILTMLEGMTHKEAADLLGITSKAVEVRVYRAKRRLSGQLTAGHDLQAPPRDSLPVGQPLLATD